MADLTTSGANDAVDAVTATATHVMLLTASPGPTGSMANELANINGYARQAVTWSVSADADETNTNEIVFQATGGDWAAATHCALVTSGVYGGGVVKAVQALTATRTVTSGSTLTFPIGSLILQGTVTP